MDDETRDPPSEPDVAFRPQRVQGDGKPEPRHPNRRGWKGKVRPLSADTFPWLDKHFLELAQSGLPDEQISKQSGLNLATIIRWRRSRGVHRRTKPTLQQKAMALNLLGLPLRDVLHRVEDSIVEGSWSPPEFVLREPLRYLELAKHLWFLRTRLGSSFELLASAFGLKPADVETAVTLYDNHMQKNGRPCDQCGEPAPKTDRYCSQHCWDAAREEGDRQ